MLRRSGLVVCLMILALAGCASSERVAKIEKRLDAVEGGKSAGAAPSDGGGVGAELEERLAAMERREETLRLEVARLERWQKSLRKLEAELAAQKKAAGTTPPATPPTPTPTKADPPAPPVFVAAPKFANKDGGAWKDAFKFNIATELGRFYATGVKGDDIAGTLKGEDLGAPGGAKPLMPRDPGEKGADNEGFVGKKLQLTRFLGSGGDSVDVDDWKGKKRVVLVVLRGYDGGVPCVACSGQTLAISQNLDQFEARDAEVYLVYPGKADTVGKFLDNVRALQGGGDPLPVQMLLDVDLAVVKEFKIEGRLAKPTTVILDKGGIVRFAHVGQSKTDRPTIPQMLAVLDRLKREGN